MDNLSQFLIICERFFINLTFFNLALTVGWCLWAWPRSPWLALIGVVIGVLSGKLWLGLQFLTMVAFKKGKGLACPAPAQVMHAWSQETKESARQFIDRGAALLLANYGTQQLQLLRAAGADVGYIIPREGALAWLDCWVITRGARNRALAHAWIDYMLEAGPAEVLSQRHGLSNTRSQPTHQSAADRLVWLEPVEHVERRILLWERIVSGDSAARVLAP